MKHIINYGLSGLLMILLFACQAPKEDANTIDTPAETTSEPIVIKAQFICRDITVEEYMPRFEIALSLNQGLHIIDTIMSCASFSSNEYAQYQIPADAVSACGGWWAGAGDYFYAILEGNVCKVMQGWQDEQQEDEGFHYEQVRRLVVSAQ